MNVTKAYNTMKSALEEIADPISFMRKRAKANGSNLNELTFAISQDPYFLRSIALEALNKIKEK